MIAYKPYPRIKHTRIRTIKAPYGQKNQKAAKRYQETCKRGILSPQNGQETRQNYRQSQNEDERQVLELDHFLLQEAFGF